MSRNLTQSIDNMFNETNVKILHFMFSSHLMKISHGIEKPITVISKSCII
jgi:hypothetical protein